MPPRGGRRRYQYVQDGEDENGPIMVPEAIPLNPADIVVKVWPYVVG